MVVVGDRKSANTKHLTEICLRRCPRVVQIERADELSPDFSMVVLLRALRLVPPRLRASLRRYMQR